MHIIKYNGIKNRNKNDFNIKKKITKIKIRHHCIIPISWSNVRTFFSHPLVL